LTGSGRPGLSRPRRVGGLVLAAGAGRRFGGPKALAELGGERLVDRAVRILSLGGADPVLVVLGAAVVDVPGADAVIVNDDWSEGMGSSLRAGLAAPELAGCTAVIVQLVDQPGIRATAVRLLVAAHDEGVDLAVATYAGERGHPVLLGRDRWADIAAGAVGDSGARGYLAAHAAEVLEVPCDGDAKDADTPAELAGRGILSRIAGDVGSSGSAGAALGAGFDELGALLGGAGARARVDEKAAEVVRRQTFESGEPPSVTVDLEAGVVRFRRDRR
jgi:CTP:molybdopterin cytidylyltransferase MocA